MTSILNSLAPVFLVVALGALLRWRGFFHAQMLADINRLAYWVGLPCLTFISIASTPLQLGAAAGLFATVVCATVAGGALAWFASPLCGVDRRARGTFVQGAFRGNLAFIGLPVIVYATHGDPLVRSLAIIAFAPIVTLYGFGAVLVLQASCERRGGRLRLLLDILFNPQLFAGASGLAWAAWGPVLPSGIVRSLEALGHMALPLALLGIGGSLLGVHFHGRTLPVLAAAAIKTLLLPLLGVVLAALFGLDENLRRAALILLATPTAAASYVQARQFEGDEAIATGSILVSTLASAPGLALVLACS